MAARDKQKILRQIPAVHEVLQHEEVEKLQRTYQLGKDWLTLFTQETIGEIREHILQGRLTREGELKQIIISRLREKTKNFISSPLKAVINGTGIILHTNLGRAKLSKQAQKELALVAQHYSNLEFNLAEGTRGSRHDLVEELICRLTGAEAALVCNNNAASVFLVLRELAANKEVIISL